jgi:2-C-methyl-D-erythritol 4-phosphate cytidylyltransferase
MLRRAHLGEPEGTDDASLVEAIGGRIVVVPGDPANRKLTLPDDLDWARERVALERR